MWSYKMVSRVKSASVMLGATFCIAAANPVPLANAEEIRISTEYSISFAGIPVARSQFNTVINEKNVTVAGSLSTAGLAAVFDSTKATSTSSGVITKSGVQSLSYRLDYKSGERKRLTEVKFKGGNAVSTTITPERAPNPKNVPVAPGDLNGVLDPFFASFISVSSRSEVCNRTIKVYDGVTRINLVLRTSGSEPFVIGKTKGEGIRCAARYQPVSGHRVDSSSVKYLSDGERGSILFGQIAGTNLYAPVKASVKTKAGTVNIRATKFSQTVE